MEALAHAVRGELLQSGVLAALWLRSGAQKTYLRCGIRLRDKDAIILPGLVVDDWGHEIRSLRLYRWIEENDVRFPRAEIFGFDMNGSPKQYFMRELDVAAKFPCYAYDRKDTPLDQGVLLQAILLADESAEMPTRSGPPADIALPLRRAQLSWWISPAAQLPSLDLRTLPLAGPAGGY